MTKYVLNSGGLRNNPALAKDFFNETVKGLGTNPKLLFCFFASPREEWSEKFSEYSNRFKEMTPAGTSPLFTLAFPDKFAEQIKDSDAIFIHGGDDHLLQHWLRQFDLPKIWEGKVIAGSSAGSNALVTHFWTCDWRNCMDGLGLLPIKFLPHFKSSYGDEDPRGPIDWEQARKELNEYGDTKLPIHALEEGYYIVIEK